jgi:hypothetical protein
MATAKQKELGAFLSPLTDLAMQMILSGTLKKNVIKHFTNKGLPFEVAENLTQCAVIKAENYQANKAK